MLKSSVEQQVREFAAFLSGVEEMLINASNRHRFAGSFFSTMAFISMSLQTLFWHGKIGGIFIIEVFPHKSVDKACSSPVVVQIADVTRDLINSVSYKALDDVRDSTVVPGACLLRGFWEKASLKVCEVWVTRIGMPSLRNMLVIVQFRKHMVCISILC